MPRLSLGRRGVALRRRTLGDVFVYQVLLTPYSLVMVAFAVAALGFDITLSLLNIDLKTFP